MSQRLSTASDRPGSSVPLIVVGGAICVVIVSTLYSLSTRWRSEGELDAAYAEVDYQAAHADMAEERVEVAERAVELKRAYYSFYFRPGYIWRTLKKTRSREELERYIKVGLRMVGNHFTSDIDEAR